jgi:hypothetical protein
MGFSMKINQDNKISGREKFKIRDKIKNSLALFILANIVWFILRSGIKPSRIYYPCQQQAINNINFSISSTFQLSIGSSAFIKMKSLLLNSKLLIIVVLIMSMASGEVFLRVDELNQEIGPVEFDIMLNNHTATSFPSSTIYGVNGRNSSHIKDLISIMSSDDSFFYKTSQPTVNGDESGLISSDDIVILKINCQWNKRGGTNTDMLKEIIETISDHPDGFTGEIVIADNGQGIGSFDFEETNSEYKNQSVQDVVNMFTSKIRISTYSWQNIRHLQVEEFSEGDFSDGYWFNDTEDFFTGLQISYPKFSTNFGSHISFKHGIWKNKTGYESHLKVINIATLKSHFRYGVTASVKNYMGVQSEGIMMSGGLANGHISIAYGGMATLMAELGMPILNVIDAIWINPNPFPSTYTGPNTMYSGSVRTNTILASTDPVGLDYWATKNILIEAAKLLGYENYHYIDPDNTERGSMDEALGIWMNLTKNEFNRRGIQATMNKEQMNIIIQSDFSVENSNTSQSSFTESNSSLFTDSVATTSFFIFGGVLTIVLFALLRTKRKKH